MTQPASAHGKNAGSGGSDSSEAIRKSKLLSSILRHDPGSVGLSLEAGGWVDVDDLLGALSRNGEAMSYAELSEIVRNSDKQRFALEGHRIRANQGHSVPVELKLTPESPPTVLYHGTAKSALASILATEIHPGSRQQVHLSPDYETALKVGARHGSPVVLEVAARKLSEAGALFFHTANNVWLVDRVPAEYLRPIVTEVPLIERQPDRG